ncbi:LytR/AlgR family response regulator transcription factor [Maribacter thermophilus]|uniref:LytR/AlgR family response regulator transcription factor n=1 Tax=Maribacter thermophilus TaxID=1197874 RepID=UPI000641698C|nr:LytTR family DNA-binding domain-containing protein [Maribacter thermophilus]
MIRCIIIEDQPPAQRVLKKFIGDMDTLVLKGIFTDAIQAMDFLQSEPIDLIFLDIHLPKISGIDFLKTLTNRPHVILTTAFSEYALESYDYNVVDYLLKPFSFERFVQAVSKVQLNRPTDKNNSPPPTTRDFVFVKSGYELIKVTINDILYIKSDADYTELYTTNKKILSQEPLRYWEKHLNSNTFIRIHRSYIINTSKIEKITGNHVRLNEHTNLPIGRAYKERFIKNVLP